MRIRSTIISDGTDTLIQRQYVNFDPEVGYNYSTAREEMERLWRESLDGKDDSIATAAAGGLVYLVYGSDGGECLSMLPLRALHRTNILCSMYRRDFDGHTTKKSRCSCFVWPKPNFS